LRERLIHHIIRSFKMASTTITTKHCTMSESDPRIYQVFRHHSAQASCRLVGDVLHITYSGVLTQEGINHLDAAVQPLRKLATVALEYMDKALTMVDKLSMHDAAWPTGTPPSAVIVRADQFQQVHELCQSLADRGVLRLVFLVELDEHAWRFTNLYETA
jgi:hypothetical protein